MLFHMLQLHKCIHRAIINDINSDLIHCYQLIHKTPQILIEQLSLLESHFFSISSSAREELYYEYRRKFNSEINNPNERAALFIFLNHTCYNGLFRVNTQGEFNVPYGRYDRPNVCNKDLIWADHKLLNSIDLIICPPGDYKLACQNLDINNTNLVYLDPPYRPISSTSYFTEYTNNPFGDKQQEELKSFCDILSNKNCLIMLSNSFSINEGGESYFDVLYKDYRIEQIMAPRFINAKGNKRNTLNEILILNY